MSTTVEDPATIRGLTRYVEREFPNLDTSYNGRCEQLVVVGRPGQHEPPAALREVLGGSRFELRAHAVDSRSRWLGVNNAANDGGNR